MKKYTLLCSAILLLLTVAASAQTRRVSGKVVDAQDGTSLPGVNIVVKGTTNGSITDTNGNYAIDAASSDVLVFSFVGMATQEVPVGDRSTIDVQMQLDVKQLQEIVVNALGEEKPKDKLGIATSSVVGTQIQQSGETTVINGLEGKAPGLNIIRNGSDPGAGSYIQLRGQSTITGNLQPLIVIDGMPMYNNYDDNGNQVSGVQQQSRLNDLNPDDIASVDIIKSAAGAALWGSRGAQGVIMITTKKGRNTRGKLDIQYTGTVDFDQVNKVPDLQTQFGQGGGGNYIYNNARSWGDRIADRSGAADVLDNGPNAPYVQFADGSKRYKILQKNSQQTYDHGKEVFHTGHYVEHDLSIGAGNDRSNFRLSYSNLNQQGTILRNSNYQRNNARFNAETQLTDKIHARVNASYANIRSNRIQQGSNLGGIFLGGLRTPPDYNNTPDVGTFYDANGIPTPNRQVSFRNQLSFKGADASSNGNPGFDNPIWTIDHNINYSVVNRFIGNTELTYDVLDWLSLKGNTGLDTYTDHRTAFINAQSAISPKGSYTDQIIFNSQWNTNLFAIANNKISENIHLSTTLGFNYNTRQNNNLFANGLNFIVPDAPPSLSNTNQNQRTITNGVQTVKNSAVFGYFDLDMWDQLSINLTGRAESSSTFGKLTKSSFFYPSATASWQFTKLIGESNFLSFGKLRASYGVVGTAPGPYNNLTQYPSTNFFESWGATLNGNVYGVGGYSISNTVGNQYIKPEKKHEVEGGFDLRFFNNRVAFSGTAYYQNITDIILPVSQAASTGFSSIVANAGSMTNKGLEFSLSPTWVQTHSGFTWKTDFIWYNYRNKVTSLSGVQSVFLSGGGFSDGSSRAVEGQPLSVLWGTYYDKNSDGSYNLDEHGFPKLAPAEGVIGNPNPKYRASIGNTFSYKGLSLYALFDFQVGGQMWNGTRGALTNYGTAAATATETTVSAADANSIKTYNGSTIASSGSAKANSDGTYTFRGVIQDFGAGKVALDESWYTSTGGGFNVNSPFVEKANWSRLRQLTLSYTLNSSAFRQATKLNSVTFGITGRNLFLWTPYSGIDPETNLTGANNGRGIDYFQNPNTKSVLFKLSITY